MRMSPLAFIQCVFYGWWSGELERVHKYGATEMTRDKAAALLINGVIAFGLNIISFTANKKAGVSGVARIPVLVCVLMPFSPPSPQPLTMAVSANCKQVLTIAIAVVMFNVHITPTNALGILLTLVGGVSGCRLTPFACILELTRLVSVRQGWYAWIEYIEKAKSRLSQAD
jgi:hypothetical protein